MTPPSTPTLLVDKSQAEIDAIIPDLLAPVEKLSCENCGRDCKHLPNLAGGGSAGGLKGDKYAPTPRSEIVCPACNGKPHRKESRISQVAVCEYRQVMNELGVTGVVLPTEAIYLKAAEMHRLGQFRKTPTEAEVAKLVRAHMGLPEPESRRKMKTATEKAAVVPQSRDKEEIVGDAVEVIPAITTDDISLPAPKIVEGSTGLKKKEPKEKKPRTKKDKKGKAADAETTGDTEEIPAITLAAADVPPDVAGDDNYDPFAGVGQSFPDDDDEEAVELTPQQKAALGL